MGRKEVQNNGKKSCAKVVAREGQTANQAGENDRMKTSQSLYLRQCNDDTEIKADELGEACKTRKFNWKA
jgi:hypothetical protein